MGLFSRKGVEAAGGAGAIRVGDLGLRTYVENRHSYGDKVVDRNESITLRWKITELQKWEVDEFRPGCNCTANTRISDDGKFIEAIYTNDLQTVLPPGGSVLNKSITVYLNDGIGKIKNNRGREVWGPNKQFFVITFTVKAI